MNRKICDILEKMDIHDDYIYTYPSIPIDKANNAIKEYAQFIKYEDIIILVDDTVFGKATDGLIMTHDFLCTHELWTKPAIIKLNDINSIDYNGAQLIINDEDFFKSNMPEKGEIIKVYLFLNMLIDTISSNKTDDVPVNSLESDSENHEFDEHLDSTDNENKQKLLDLLVKCQINDAHIFLAPNIPPSKLNNAIAAYANEIDPEDVILLIDDTVFGGAKEGLILTGSDIYIHAKLQSPITISFSEIESITFNKTKLYIGDTFVYDSIMPSEDEIAKVFTVISDFINPHESSENTPPEINDIKSQCKASNYFSKICIHNAEMHETKSSLNTASIWVDRIFSSGEDADAAWDRDSKAESQIELYKIFISIQIVDSIFETLDMAVVFSNDENKSQYESNVKFLYRNKSIYELLCFCVFYKIPLLLRKVNNDELAEYIYKFVGASIDNCLVTPFINTLTQIEKAKAKASLSLDSLNSSTDHKQAIIKRHISYNHCLNYQPDTILAVLYQFVCSDDYMPSYIADELDADDTNAEHLSFLTTFVKFIDEPLEKILVLIGNAFDD